MVQVRKVPSSNLTPLRYRDCFACLGAPIAVHMALIREVLSSGIPARIIDLMVLVSLWISHRKTEYLDCPD